MHSFIYVFVFHVWVSIYAISRFTALRKIIVLLSTFVGSVFVYLHICVLFVYLDILCLICIFVYLLIYVYFCVCVKFPNIV